MRFTLLVILFLLLLSPTSFYGQSDQRIMLYDPQANASAQIDSVVTLAKAKGKHVLLQVGGNWCSWCIRFHNFCQNDARLDSILKADYILLKVNYSRENTNDEVMDRLDFPQRFGFPVFVVLDGEGNRLHTQDSGYLELEGSYDRNKVELFFRNWSHKALNPATYR
ncbi:MAG: thioredoxin family protein [Bacteroidia bacterium]|nr:thioredoxin family protein [Bacteroidia bacterium]